MGVHSYALSMRLWHAAACLTTVASKIRTSSAVLAASVGHFQAKGTLTDAGQLVG